MSIKPIYTGSYKIESTKGHSQATILGCRKLSLERGEFLVDTIRSKKDESKTDSQRPMYLESLEIKSFRSARDTRVKLRPELTLLVGENNAGKSNIIEAVRLATEPLGGRRTRYFEVDDVARGDDSNEIKISLTFGGCTDFQKAFFISGLNLESGNIHYQSKYQPPSDTLPRGRVDRLAGKYAGPDSEPEARGRINHVYLAPLRDAQRELDSAGGRRLGTILKFLLDKKESADFVKVAEDSLNELAGQAPIVNVKKKIQSHLKDLTEAVRGQNVSLEFESPQVESLARGLRLKMGEHGLNPVDLASSGLGYANLLYMSTILLELQVTKESELTILLVEEPEAHLHPQLQAVLLDFLQEQAKNSTKNNRPGKAAGRLQVIATTHSPNLASAAGLDNVVVVRSVEQRAKRNTAALSLCDVDFSENPKEHSHNKRKIEQYLDVTRSELLFSRRVVLVEGISEAVILPALAKYCVFSNNETATADYRKFRSASLISVGSVDFRPYLKLLLHNFGNGERLVEKFVVLTDEDPPLDKPEDAYNRKSNIEEEFSSAVNAGVLKVIESPFTLEASLLTVPDNAEFLQPVYLAQHRNSEPKWKKIKESDDPMAEMHRFMNLKANDPSGDKNLDLRKGQFAHDLALELQRVSFLKEEASDSDNDDAEQVKFVCPPALEKAIRFVAEVDKGAVRAN